MNKHEKNEMNDTILRVCLKPAAEDWVRPAATKETAGASMAAGKKEPGAGLSAAQRAVLEMMGKYPSASRGFQRCHSLCGRTVNLRIGGQPDPDSEGVGHRAVHGAACAL